MSVRRMTHLGICVSELERSVSFYREVLGFVEVGRFRDEQGYSSGLLELADVRLTAVYLERDGWRIELLFYGQPVATGSNQRRAMNGLGFTHLSFVVDDLDEIVAKVAGHGGSVVESSRIETGVRAIFATDPDGTRLELIERDGDPMQIPGSG